MVTALSKDTGATQAVGIFQALFVTAANVTCCGLFEPAIPGRHLAWLQVDAAIVIVCAARPVCLIAAVSNVLSHRSNRTRDSCPLTSAPGPRSGHWRSAPMRFRRKRLCAHRHDSRFRHQEILDITRG
jgi:hypothetical protein